MSPIFKLIFFCLIARILSKRSFKQSLNSKIEQINNSNTTWKAGKNFDKDYSLKQYKSLFGKTNFDDLEVVNTTWEKSKMDIPEFFDAREKWPECKMIGEIYNQGSCTNWAVLAASVLSDRFCVQSKGKIKVRLSAHNLLTCCNFCGFGCGSADTTKIYRYLSKHGIVSGGPYGSEDGCQPYGIAPCESEVDKKVCIGNISKTPQCEVTCTNKKFTKKYEQDKYHIQKFNFLGFHTQDFKYEIFLNGPTEVPLIIDNDLYHYKSGIYQPKGNKGFFENFKVLGWGVENGTNYFLVANTWGPEWGDEKGFFKYSSDLDVFPVPDVKVVLN